MIEGLRVWPVSDVGVVRDHNEDAFLVDRKLDLFIVADGMGGHAAGEVASNMAVRSVRAALLENDKVIERYESSRDNRTEVLELMEMAVQLACGEVHEAAQKDEGKRGMGTTLDAVLIVGGRAFVAHVGDARVYLYRQGLVHQVTEDHSVINELLKRGRLTRDQIERMQYKNAVTRAVGVYESVEVDLYDFEVLADDRLLLCSDGLTQYLVESELAELFDAIAEDRLSAHMVELAKQRGGSDNITTVVVQLPQRLEGSEGLAEELALKIRVLHRMPLFRHLSYQELVRVLNLTDVRGYGAGDVIIEEGSVGDELFILMRGNVEVISGGQVLRRMGPGRHFGEMALADGGPRSATVKSVDECEVLVLNRQDFFSVVREDHELAVKMLWSFVGSLSERLRGTSRRFEDLQLRAQSMLGEAEADDLEIVEEVDG